MITMRPCRKMFFRHCSCKILYIRKRKERKKKEKKYTMKISFDTYDKLQEKAQHAAPKVRDPEGWFPKKAEIDSMLDKPTIPGLTKLLTAMALKKRVSEEKQPLIDYIRKSLYNPRVLTLVDEPGAFKGVTLSEEEYIRMEHITDNMEYRPVSMFDNWYPSRSEIEQNLLEHLDKNVIAFLLWTTKTGTETLTKEQQETRNFIKSLLYREDVLAITD